MSISNQDRRYDGPARFEVGKTYENNCFGNDDEQNLTCTVTKITRCFIEVTGDINGRFKLHTFPHHQSFCTRGMDQSGGEFVFSTLEVSE